MSRRATPIFHTDRAREVRLVVKGRLRVAFWRWRDSDAVTWHRTFAVRRIGSALAAGIGSFDGSSGPVVAWQPKAQEATT